MGVSIEKDSCFGESSITVAGFTQHYGTKKVVLVSSDDGLVKFPGLRYSAASDEQKTLEDSAYERFEEQTGLKVWNRLGLRTIMPGRSRHKNQWIFRYLFFCDVDEDSVSSPLENDRGRSLYLADPGRGIRRSEVEAMLLGDSDRISRISWVAEDNREVARVVADVSNDLDWYSKVPCVGASPLAESSYRPLGCGLAVASMVLCQGFWRNPRTLVRG